MYAWANWKLSSLPKDGIVHSALQTLFISVQSTNYPYLQTIKKEIFLKFWIVTDITGDKISKLL